MHRTKQQYNNLHTMCFVLFPLCMQVTFVNPGLSAFQAITGSPRFPVNRRRYCIASVLSPYISVLASKIIAEMLDLRRSSHNIDKISWNKGMQKCRRNRDIQKSSQHLKKIVLIKIMCLCTGLTWIEPEHPNEQVVLHFPAKVSLNQLHKIWFLPQQVHSPADNPAVVPVMKNTIG